VIYFYRQLHGHRRIAQAFTALARSAQAVRHFLEVISKRQIAFESKAQADEKAQHTPFPEISGDLQQFSGMPMPQRRMDKLLVIRRIAKKCLIRIGCTLAGKLFFSHGPKRFAVFGQTDLEFKYVTVAFFYLGGHK
jgi:hypothetical protein